MIHDVSLYMAFAAGLISFLSPCVLPLIPGYVSFVSGVSFEQTREKTDSIILERKDRSAVMLASFVFVLGFSTVFILLGASATWIGTYLSSKISALTRVAGLVIIFFGIYKMGLIRSLFFYREAKFHFKERKFGVIGGFFIGAAFAFGWTPCIGPILAGILTYAGTQESANQGLTLLTFYSLGLGIPFLLTALGVNQFFRFFDRVKKYLRHLEVITGIVMIILGLMIFTNKLVLIPGYLSFFNRFAL